MKSKILIALLLTVTVSDATIVPVLAQTGSVTRQLTRTFGRVARVAEADAVAAVRFGRIPRRSITPILNSARGPVTRASVISAVRSNAIRREFSATVGSLSRTSRTLPALSMLPKLGSYTTGRTAVEISRQSLRHAADIRKLFSSNLPATVTQSLGKTYSVAIERAAAARALETQSIAIERAFNQGARLHKNSRFYRAPSHVYVIVGPNGRLFKVGESSAGVMKNGLSKRAQAQVNELNSRLNTEFNKKSLPTWSGDYRSRIIRTFDSKQDARNYERELILRYEQRYPERRVLLGNHERYRSR